MIVNILSISLGAILIENFVLVRFLGICPFLRVSRKADTAVGLGLAVTFVMSLSSVFCWLVNAYILVPLSLQYLQIVAYILVIAALVQLVELFLHRMMPTLSQALGVYFPLITINCAVLGVVLISTQYGYDFITTLVYGVASGIGFTLAISLLACVRERLEFSSCPKAFEGLPIALVSAGLIALAFMGFTGLKIW